MYYIDGTKSSVPGWISAYIKRQYPFMFFLTFTRGHKTKNGDIVYGEEVRWLIDNYSTRAGHSYKQYEYLYQGRARGKQRVGVAFVHEEQAMAFKLRFENGKR